MARENTVTVEERQKLRAQAEMLLQEGDIRNVQLFPRRAIELLDALDQAEQQADSLSNALYDEREQNESLQVALNEKTAEITQLKQHIRDLEEMLRLAGMP